MTLIKTQNKTIQSVQQ